MIALILSLGFLTQVGFAYPHHHPHFNAPLRKIYQLEEGKELMRRVEAQGPLTVTTAQHRPYIPSAAWCPDDRSICINVNKSRSPGDVITSIVFEMHNALSQADFDYYDQLAMQGGISKAKYVETIEYIEYLNVLKTKEVLKKGVSLGIFPEDAHFPVAPNFEEHFRFQQQVGHSDFIADLWESLNKSRMI